MMSSRDGQGLHIKNHRGLWVTYYCPVEDSKKRLPVDVEDACPICGGGVRWREHGR